MLGLVVVVVVEVEILSCSVLDVCTSLYEVESRLPKSLKRRESTNVRAPIDKDFFFFGSEPPPLL